VETKNLTILLLYCTADWKACQETSKRHLKGVWYSYNKLRKPTANNDLLSEIKKPQTAHTCQSQLGEVLALASIYTAEFLPFCAFQGHSLLTLQKKKKKKKKKVTK